MTRRHSISLVALLGCLPTASVAVADESGSGADTGSGGFSPLSATELNVGPFDLHPGLAAGSVYDDNIYFASSHQDSDVSWRIQPALQAIAGDNAYLVRYLEQNYDVLRVDPGSLSSGVVPTAGLTAGSLIIQSPEVWPGKILSLYYAPREQIYDQYTSNDNFDQYAGLKLLWPMDKLILGFDQTYQRDKNLIIEANERAVQETAASTLSAAYRLSDRTSLESDFRYTYINYNAASLTGYSEYGTEDWFNYNLTGSTTLSAGLLAGYDAVDANNQDQTYEQIRVRARYNFTQKMVFDISAGGEEREFQSNRSGDLTPVFNAGIYYRALERTTLYLGGYRQQYASIYNGYNYISTGGRLGVAQRITDRFKLDASGGYFTLDYKGVTSRHADYTDDYYTARVSVEAKIIRHLIGQIYYNLLYKSPGISGEVTDNQVGVNLRLSY